MREIKRCSIPRLAQSRRDPQRRSRRACEEPEAAARLRPDRRQMHRMRVLRAEVPVARAHAVASAAHRRLAGDRRASVPARMPRDVAAMRALYDYRHRHLRRLRTVRHRCPVGIETGLLIKALRGRRAGPFAQRVAGASPVIMERRPPAFARDLPAADLLHGLVGTRVMQRSLDGMRRHRAAGCPSGRPRCRVPSISAARKAAARRRRGAHRLFPELCRAQHGSATRRRRGTVPVAAERLFRKAGFDVIYPEALAELCCGQPFESKGDGGSRREVGGTEARAARGQRQRAMADRVRHESMRVSNAALLPWPTCGQDSIEFIHDTVLPRVAIAPIASRSRCTRCAASARWARWTS